MRAWVIGEVVGVESREYPKRDGSTGVELQVFVRQDGSSLQYGADRLVADPAKVTVSQGDRVQLLVNFSERHGVKASGEAWGRLNAYILECHAADSSPALAAV